MNIKLNKKDQLPLHAQLKAQLIYLIRSGYLQVGAQLPTVRQLAGFLRINRNTVSKVFCEMEKDGYLSCEPGRGTFVAEKKSESKMWLERMDQLLGIMDESIDKARDLGFSAEEFCSILYARVQTTPPALRTARASAVFIECNRPQIEAFSKELEKELPLTVEPMLIQDFQSLVERSPESVNRYDVIVTTFYHIKDVQTALAGTGKEAVGLMLNTSLDALMRLTALPANTVVGVACVDPAGSENLKLSIEQAGLTHLKLIMGCGADPESVRNMIEKASVVLCSSFVEEPIRAMTQSGKEIIQVIVDERGLDPSGIEMLRNRLRSISPKQTPPGLAMATH